MKKPYTEGVANHYGSESCSREAVREAVDRDTCRPAIEVVESNKPKTKLKGLQEMMEYFKIPKPRITEKPAVRPQNYFWV